ncbi:MAG TPA: TetR family transcriptional regulator C-terminal domain-containing protein, partial [Thermoleophilaceae bacterium]|nr:TetR family transcriptional regulator C-terminal domain-containing protein [Thermoleophilaceae bacterium]
LSATVPQAGVSRGLLHYYFGSKERLLVEVVRQDCDRRVAALEERLAAASTADETVAVLVESLQAFVADEPGAHAVLYEMLSASRHSEEIRVELVELYRTWRAHMAAALRTKQQEGVIALDGDPEAVAALLFALGDGMGLQLISDPEWDSAATLELGMSTVRRLLGSSS